MARAAGKAKASGKPAACAKKPEGPRPGAEPAERLMAPHELLLASPVQGAIGIQAWGNFAGEADLVALLKGLKEDTDRVVGGDMRPVEGMLFGQAKVLETIATSLMRRATGQEYLKQFQTYLTLALKAQAQCRATLEALAEIKNPRPVAFVKQANIAGGHQQVVNGGPSAENQPVRAGAWESATVRAGASAHAEQTASLKNGLLEAGHGIELDTRAQSAASDGDSCLEAVDAGHRAAHA